MILEYHRPVQIEAALELLAREQPFTLPLGGGTILSRPSADSYAVVDLQALGLDRIERQGNLLVIGATVTLQSLSESSEIQPALRECLRHEAAFNLRQAGTIAGTLAAADGRSPFAVAMMALDARLTWLPGDEETNLGDWLPVRTY
jgi:putative selenate reductase FAD-binding subunit